MCAARARDIYEQQAKERQKRKPADSVPENLPEQKTDARDAAGKAFGVSGKSVDHAKQPTIDSAAWIPGGFALVAEGNRNAVKEKTVVVQKEPPLFPPPHLFPKRVDSVQSLVILLVYVHLASLDYPELR